MLFSPHHYVPTMAYAILSIVLLGQLVPSGARSLQSLLRRPGAASAKASSGLLQALARKHGAAKPAKDIGFFSEDADKMAQMPPYLTAHAGHLAKNRNPALGSRYAVPGAKVCDPKCSYSCGHRECDQACEPQCLPPKCETICMKSADKCETRCAKPKCAVICPATVECSDGNCPKCRSLCAPPACTTSCSDSCHSVCSKPRCRWKCHVGKCPKPSCKMACTGLEPCSEFMAKNLTKVPLMPGLDIKTEARASLDPQVLATPPKAPPPPGFAVAPTIHPESSLGYENVPVYTPVPPVQALKMRWQAQDLINANERLLRR